MLKVIQITDLHLADDPRTTLKGVNTLDTLCQCLEHAGKNHADAELMLATGDLVHDAGRDAVVRLDTCLRTLGLPTGILAGNHDDWPMLCNELGDICDLHYIDRSNWRIILLNSAVPDQVAGRLEETELQRLEQLLAQSTARHSLVCLHHQPVPTGSAWLDKIMLENPEPMFDIIDRFPHVRGILWGHIHQEFESRRNDVLMLGSPSTCIQFKPGQQDFGLDDKPPGYRWLELHEDGGIRTGVEWLAEMPELDPDAGY